MSRTRAAEGGNLGRVTAAYATEAEAYRDLWAPVLEPIALELVAKLPEASKVLDLGCGVGTLLPHLRSRLSAECVTGVDATHDMIALADPGSQRIVADMAHLPLADRSFDLVVSAFVLFHTPRPQDAIAEARRVLRLAGTVGIVTWESDSGCRAQDVWTETLDQHGAPAEDQPHSWHELVNTRHKVTALLADAGFGNIRAWTVSRSEELTPEAFTERRLRLGVSRRRLEGLDPTIRERCVSVAAERVRQMERQAFRSEWRFILAMGRA